MSDSFKQQHAWRSKFRSRSHDEAHDQEHAHQPVADHAGVFAGKPELVASAEALEALIQRLRAAGSFAYDSEFIGEMSYVPRLCLIQIATETEIALVDPLAELDLLPLWNLMADPQVQKIVHAGPQDMEPVMRLTGRPAANVVDTQIAAGFAYLPYPISLQRLVLQLVKVKLGKGLTFTHWDQRPLSAQQVRYAADDVRYLPAAWAELHQRVESAGTMAWVRTECDAMCQASPYDFDPETSFLKVRGAGSLDPRQLGILRELAAWRNGEAKKADLPARTYLRDDILVELVRRSPADDEKLQNIQGLPRPVRINHCAEILQAIVRGKQRPADSGIELRKSDELPEAQFRNDALFALAQTLAMARGVDPQVALTRSDIAELTSAAARGRDVSTLRLMNSWRRELLGDVLLGLIQEGGQVALRLDRSSGQLTVAT